MNMNSDNYPAPSHQNSQNLPSTELQERVIQLEEEIHLRDYLDVLLRRKWTIIIVLLVSFLLAAFYTFTTTPIFTARGVMKVSSQRNNITNFDNLETSSLKTLEFQQTQVKLLTSEQLTNRVISNLNLYENQTFNQQAGNNSKESGGFFNWLKNLIRFESSGLANLDKELQGRLVEDKIIEHFKLNFKVTPIRSSELIEISYESSNPQLAAEITNTSMKEFINMHMDSKIEASKTAGKFLDRQIRNAQIKLEKSEKQLHQFSSAIGIVSLDPKLNLIMRQLEELNDALAKSQAVRITKEAIYKQAINTDSNNLSQILTNELIKDLKNQLAAQHTEYQDLSTKFKDGYPKMQQLLARINELDSRIESERKKIIRSIENDYQSALKTENYLREKAELQKKKALDLQEKATQYKIIEREVESNKTIYQSLLLRSKEIESTIGADITNLQIVDTARVPLYPSKPRVALNLLLGIVSGLLCGIFTAFFLEHLDDTIKDPDELTDRFKVPVLGLVPFMKQMNNNRQEMALQVFNNPRSPVAEAIRTTMTSIHLIKADTPIKTILITSILPNAGKSSFATNAALSYLSEGNSCLLIDVDLRRPSLHHIFEIEKNQKGLSNILSGRVKREDVIQTTKYNNLHYISSGPLPLNPAELLSSKRMRALLSEMKKEYDHIILDCAPFQGFAEVLVLSNMVDGVILMVSEGDTPRSGVKYFKKAIHNVRGHFLGTVMNRFGRKKGYGYGFPNNYKYYSYNYDYGNASREKTTFLKSKNLSRYAKMAAGFTPDEIDGKYSETENARKEN